MLKTSSKQKTPNIPKLRFPGFEGEWEERRLGEISSLITKGTTPTSVGYFFTKEGVNFIKAENIDSSYNIRIGSTPKVSKECDEALKRSRLKENDILFSIAGTLGRTAIVKKSDLPANTNQAISIIRLKEEARVGFINIVLNTSRIKKRIHELLSIGAQPNLSLDQVSNFILPLPSFSEQQKIADFLISVDGWIERLRAERQAWER